MRVLSGVSIVLVLVMVAGCLSAGTARDDAPTSAKKIQASPRSEAVYPGQYKFDGDYSQVIATGPYKSKEPVHLLIPSIDGTNIEIVYWLPDVPTGTKVPVILQASPYYNLGSDLPRLSGYLVMLHDNFVQHGYAVAAASVRGTGLSGGCMDLMGRLEVQDMDAAVTWLGTQEWSNGNVGMIGLSYDGSTPWDVAATGNEHLKTIVPISGLPDIFSLGYRNGSSEDRMAGIVSGLYYGTNLAPALSAADFATETPTMLAGRIVCPESWKGFVASFTAVATGERDPLGFWEERNRKPLIEKNYRGSVFHIQGLQDWNVDPSLTIPWTSYLNLTNDVPLKMLLGQWTHSYPDTNQEQRMRWDWAEILLHWFDYWLKGQTQVDTGPAVQVQDDKHAWRNEDFWPPRDATWVTKHLAAGAKLADEPGAAGAIQLLPNPVAEMTAESFRQLPYQSADFNMPVLERDLLLAGLPRLHVTVRPQGPTGHIAAWLYDVDGETETRIGWTTMNLNFYDGGETRKELVPNTPVLAKMEFQPLDATVPAGHSLRVRVWQYSSEGDRMPAIPPEPVELLYGGQVQSILELPTLERDASDYFAPPMPPGSTAELR